MGTSSEGSATEEKSTDDKMNSVQFRFVRVQINGLMVVDPLLFVLIIQIGWIGRIHNLNANPIIPTQILILLVFHIGLANSGHTNERSFDSDCDFNVHVGCE